MQQLTLLDESLDWLDAFERRLRQLRLSRLFYWTRSLREILGDLRRERKQAYEVVMQIELDLGHLELEPAEHAMLLERLARVKGLLAMLLLSLVIHGVADGQDAMRRPGGGSGVRVVRTVRRGREDNLNLA